MGIVEGMSNTALAHTIEIVAPTFELPELAPANDVGDDPVATWLALRAESLKARVQALMQRAGFQARVVKMRLATRARFEFDGVRFTRASSALNSSSADTRADVVSVATFADGHDGLVVNRRLRRIYASRSARAMRLAPRMVTTGSLPAATSRSTVRVDTPPSSVAASS